MSSSVNSDHIAPADLMKDGANKELECPTFKFSSISDATNNFSSVNKLGEGGFGPVYKVRYFPNQDSDTTCYLLTTNYRL